MTFHDGAPLTADFVREFLDSARVDPRSLLNNPALADIDAVDAVGKDVVRLHYRRDTYLRLEGLSIRIERQLDGKPEGTGPFMLQKQTRDAMTLVANSEYRGGTPTIDVVRVETYPTTRNAWVAMMRQDVDFLIDVPNRARDFVGASSDVEVFEVNRPYATVIGFNVGREPFTDPRVRRALNHAVDRRMVIDRALGGAGRPTTGLNTSHWAFRESARSYTFDPRMADQLLADAGFAQPSTSASNSREGGMRARLRFTCLVAENRALDEIIALIVQRQLYEIGVDMLIEALDLERLVDRANRQDYQAVLRPQNISRDLSRLYALWHSSQPYAVPGYTAADTALDALRSATSRDAVRRRAREFQTLLYEDPPALFLVADQQARALSSRFVVPDEPDLDVVETIGQWRPRDSSQ